MDSIKLLYFQSPGCGVCHALRPKLEAMLVSDYPKLHLHIIDISQDKITAAQHAVFVTPVLIILWEGKEQERFVRAFSVGEVAKRLDRFMSLLA
ncbi:MAG: thioredoxin family protein [Bacteroidota bacterium]